MGVGALGLVLGGPWIIVVVQHSMYLRSRGLTLSEDWFEFAGFATRWADVDEVSECGHFVKVTYKTDAQLDHHARISVALSKWDYHAPPAYIYAPNIETGGHPLIGIMGENLQSYRSGDHPREPADVVTRETEPRDSVELVLPLRRMRALLRLFGAGAVLVCVLGTTAGMWSSDSADKPTWLGAATLVTFVFVFVLPAGFVTVMCARTLFAGGLRLDKEGFRLADQRWLWADLARVERDGDQINVVYRPEVSAFAGPSLTGIDVGRFDTSGEPLDELLSQWLLFNSRQY